MEQTNNKISGHVLIKDQFGNILCDKYNAINQENFSLAIARALAGSVEGHIYEMRFGNGGASISTTGAITYLPSNVNSYDSSLYNTTYTKIIDELSTSNSDPNMNSVIAKHAVGTTYSDVFIRCTLDFFEPQGQSVHDDVTNLETDFTFDELGLYTYSPSTGQSLMLSHVIFAPIVKSLNRSIEINYTIRIQLC